ncbi:ABC-2 type transport system permease protein [Bacillus sp. cl95]|nr:MULTISPECIES: ABC-2 family transporter protein [unclassified Bacillus (in: firmicutes)]SFB08130.1 ABC-2 type transport system permease protein [Bacillus sp. UNCCL13]SFQ87146.1 ABC-2 type transport system permease protein [Bacillus sp. cl95]
MKRYSRLYWEFAKSHMKVMMEYRIDFLIGIFSVMLEQFASIFFVKVVFDHIEQINGWSFYEILFIYGIAATGRSIHQIFFDNLWTLGWQYIRPGQLDRLLIRPVNPLFHLLADRLHQDGFGQLFIGLIILGTSIPHLDIAWGAMEILFLIIMIISSGMIFVAINLFFATFSFWMVDSLPIVWAVFNLSDFARYPLTIYHKGIRTFLTWIIPYGFTAFYPAAYFIGKSGYKEFALWTPVVALVCCFIAYSFWNRGLKAFASTGS